LRKRIPEASFQGRLESCAFMPGACPIINIWALEDT
jgi:hypothetical protein